MERDSAQFTKQRSGSTDIDGEEASSLADRVEEFLAKNGAHSQREYHSDTDIRVLATVD